MDQNQTDSASGKSKHMMRIAYITAISGLLTAIGASVFVPQLLDRVMGRFFDNPQEQDSGGSTASNDKGYSPEAPSDQPPKPPLPITKPEPERKPELKELKRLQIERVTMDVDNKYSSNDLDKLTDNSHLSYWSTSAGNLIDATFNFKLSENSSINRIDIISTRNGGGYTQAQSIKLGFENKSGENILIENDSGEKSIDKVIELNSPSKSWEVYTFPLVQGVETIKLQLLDPINREGTYLTLNEVQFYLDPAKN